MKYLSTFTGIGGFELGINKAYEELQNISNSKELQYEKTDSTELGQRGLDYNSERERLGNPECIGYSEINKYAIQIYQSKFPEHHNYGDITKINEKELPDFDLFVGGFPCQAFSIAGKRRGFDDTRGTLFFDIARILKEKRPRNFILENVKGLLSHDNGRTFKTIINTLVELGYCVEWQVLNAKNFGVPQSRERVFIIGHLGGIPERKVFPIRESNGATVKKLGNKNPSGHGQSGQVVSPEGLHPTLGAGGGNPDRQRDIGWSSGYIAQLNNPTHSNDRVYGTEGISPTLNTMQGGNRQPFIRNPYNGKQSEVETGTLGTSCGTTTGKTAQLLHKDTRIRRLTPLECERLMGYPDNWTEGLSDTQRYKCLGNGLVSNIVVEIVKRLYL